MILFSCTYSAYSGEEHHNFIIDTCRALPSGYIQIVGISETDSQSRSILFTNGDFLEKVLDRYLSLCLTSLASGAKLRIDYLNCTSTTCVTTGGTSLNLFK
jgi:hypothetical protein